MKLLAIDPGTSQSAYVLLESEDWTIIDKAIIPNEDMWDLCKWIECDEAVIEMVKSYGNPVGDEVFETVRWIGMFWSHLLDRRDIPVAFASRKSIVTQLCDNPRAGDSIIHQRLIDIFGPKGTKKAPGKLYGFKFDMWSALAVAVYHLQKKRGWRV